MTANAVRADVKRVVDYLTGPETASVHWLDPNRDPDFTFSETEAEELAHYLEPVIKGVRLVALRDAQAVLMGEDTTPGGMIAVSYAHDLIENFVEDVLEEPTR